MILHVSCSQILCMALQTWLGSNDSYGGDKPGSPYQCICRARGPAQKRIPPRPGKADDKGDGLSLRVTLWTIPWKKISIKKEQDKGRHGNIWEKAATIALNALQLTESCFSAFTTTLKDFREGLMGQVSTLLI